MDEMVQKRPPLGLFRLKIPKNILNQDHRRIDDDPEVDRAERQKICILTPDHEQDDGEKQRKWNIRADNDGAAQITQEKPLDEEHEEAAENKIMQDGMRGDGYQRAAVIKGNDLDSRRQRPIRIYFVDFGLDKGKDRVRMLCPAHDDDRGGDIVVMIPPRDAEARNVADRHIGDVLDQNGNAVGLRQDDIFDVTDLIAVGDDFIPAIVDQANAADVHGLLPDGDLAGAYVDIRISYGSDQLRHGDIKSF